MRNCSQVQRPARLLSCQRATGRVHGCRQTRGQCATCWTGAMVCLQQAAARMQQHEQPRMFSTQGSRRATCLQHWASLAWTRASQIKVAGSRGAGRTCTALCNNAAGLNLRMHAHRQASIPALGAAHTAASAPGDREYRHWRGGGGGMGCAAGRFAASECSPGG